MISILIALVYSFSLNAVFDEIREEKSKKFLEGVTSSDRNLNQINTALQSIDIFYE